MERSESDSLRDTHTQQEAFKEKSDKDNMKTYRTSDGKTVRSKRGDKRGINLSAGH